MAVGEAQQFRPEADGKSLGSDAAPPRNEIVAHLMNEHHDGQNEQKRYDCPDQQTFATENRARASCKLLLLPNFHRLSGSGQPTRP